MCEKLDATGDTAAGGNNVTEGAVLVGPLTIAATVATAAARVCIPDAEERRTSLADGGAEDGSDRTTLLSANVTF